MLVIALVARHLGVESYGVYNYVISVVAVLSPFSVFGLSGVLVRYCIDSKNVELSNIISSAICLRFIGSLLVVVLVIFFIYFSNLQNEIALYLILLAISELFKCLTAVASWFEANLLNRITAKVKITVVCISALFKLFGVFYSFTWKYFVIVQGIEVVFYAFLLLGVFKIYSKIKINFVHINRFMIKEFFYKGLPLLMSSIGAVIYLKSDILMIKYFLDERSVGIYAAATRISELGFIVPVILMTALFPSMIKNKVSGHFDKAYNRRVLSVMFYLGILLSITIFLLSDFIIESFFGEKFAKSSGVLAVHCFCLPIVFMRTYVSKWIISEEVYYVSLTTQITGAASNLVLNYFLIPEYGIYGAAYGTILSLLFASIIPLLFHKISRELSLDMFLSPFYPIIKK